LSAITQNPEAVLRELALFRARLAVFNKETVLWKALNLGCAHIEAFLNALLPYMQISQQLKPVPADAGRAALANDPEEELCAFKGAVWQPEIRDFSRVDDFLKVLVPLAWQLRLDVYDAAKGVYLPVFHTPVPQEAGSRYLLEYYPQVATRDLMLDSKQFSGLQEILGNADAVPKPGRENKLFAPMPLPFLSHLSREGDLLLVDSEESCFCHTELVRDRYIWRLQGPLEEHGFALKRRNLGCFDFKRSKGKQSISTVEGGCSSIYLLSHSKRLADIFIQHMEEKHCKKVCVLSEDRREGILVLHRNAKGFTTLFFRLGAIRRLCVPSWIAVAESSVNKLQDIFIDREINMPATSHEEIDWLAEDLLHYALPIMNEALTVGGMDNLYNRRFRVSELFRVAPNLFGPISCSLVYARLAGNPEFDRIADEIKQTLMKEEKEYYMELYTDLLDVCKKHLHPLDKDAPA
jgi:hypothetical protein